MADPTAVVNLGAEQRYLGRANHQITNSETLVKGAVVSAIFGTAGTPAQFAADEAGAWPIGLAVGPESGRTLTGANAGNETDPAVVTAGEMILKDAAVTAVAADTDIGKPVYATDGQTLSITTPADDALPMGFVYDKDRGSTDAVADVFVLGKVLSWLLAMGGGVRKTHCLGTLTAYTAGYIVGSASTGIKLRGHGKIVTFQAFVTAVATDDTKETSIALKINDAAVTGGAADLDVSELQTQGGEVTVTAITGANEFHDGDLLQITATGGSPPVDGAVTAFIEVEYLPGA